MKIESGARLKELLLSGMDLYNVTTEKYVFLYNDQDAICVYDIPKAEAIKLNDEAKMCEDRWSALLGPGGYIYDEPNDDWCEANYKGDWRVI